MAIKKIPVSRLEPGMFIHDLNCGWMDHPFLVTRFKLESERDLMKIREAGLREVYIDTALGRALDDAPTVAEAEQELDRQMRQLAEANDAAEPDSPTREELARAHKIHSEANLIMRNVMRDAAPRRAGACRAAAAAGGQDGRLHPAQQRRPALAQLASRTRTNTPSSIRSVSRRC
jgi:hypothetical protein